MLRSAIVNKVRLTALSVLVLGALASGAAFWNQSPAAAKEANHARSAQQSRTVARAEDRTPAPGRMTVDGSVVDPSGRPMAGVPVELIGRERRPMVAGDEWRSPYASLGRGTTGADGRFRFDAERTSRVGFLQVQAVAAAPGFGLSWAAPNPDAEQPAGEIRLRPEQVISGKLIDLNGKPIAGLEIFVKTLRRHDDDWIGAYPSQEILTWPPKVKTDDEGRFTLSGIGRDMTVYLGIDDPRFAKATTIQVTTRLTLEKNEESQIRPPADNDCRGPRAGRRHRPAHPACDRQRRIEHQPIQERRGASLRGRRPGPIYGQRCAGPVLQHPGLPSRRSAVPDPRAQV